MEDIKEEHEEAKDEISPLKASNSRRQHQRIRFSEESEEVPKEKKKLTFKTIARASRLLSICDPSTQLPSVQLRRLRQLHSRGSQNDNEEISDELLEKLPFKYD